MSRNFEQLLKLAVVDSLKKEIQKYENSSEQDLNRVDLEFIKQKKLSKQILLLPDEGKFVLFGKYCFGFTYSEIEFFLNMKNTKGLTRYYQKMLSVSLLLKEEQTISDTSMRRACKEALRKYLKKELYSINNQVDVHQLKIKVGLRKLAKNVAIAAIITAMSFSTLLVANAEFKERVFSWVMETFEKFSVIKLKNSEEQSHEGIQNYVPSYIPEGFKLENTIVQPKLILIEYRDENTNFFEILVNTSDTLVYKDTEEVTLEEIELQGFSAYYFKKEGINNLIFEKDGFHIELFGNISKSYLIKIAEGIKRQQ